MLAGLVIFLLAMAALSFWVAHSTNRERPGFFARDARTAGITFLMFALVFAVLAGYKRVEDNRAVKALAAKIQIYPGAKFVVRVNKTWLFEAEDSPGVVAAFYEQMGREKTNSVEKTDDFKFVAKTKTGGRARIDIQDDLKGSTISYILDEAK